MQDEGDHHKDLKMDRKPVHEDKPQKRQSRGTSSKPDGRKGCGHDLIRLRITK